MKTVRWGVLGNAKFARDHMAPAIHMAENAELVALATSNPGHATGWDFHPGLAQVSYDDLLADPTIDAVYIPLPNHIHVEWTLKAIAAGKHVVLEKPFTSTVAQGLEVLEAAEKKGVITMVDHTFLYTGAVRRIKQLTQDGTLGNIYFYDSARTNLGLFQRDCNVIWDLAPHDFSIMNHVIGKKPVSVRAMGADHVGRGFADVAYVHVDFGDSTIAHFHISWLSPIKERQTVIGGDQKMVVWDDNNAAERVKIYDKGFSVTAEPGKHPAYQYRNGEYEVAQVEQTEALALMLEEFASSISEKRQPLTSGADGVDVVRILEACERSISLGGEAVNL